MADRGSHKARYEDLSKDRTQFLQRARHNALLTIPSILPLESQSGTSHLIEPYQGLGGRVVVHLSSRLLVGLLPSGRPYMRLDLPPEKKVQTGGEVDTSIARGLALTEELIHGEVNAAGWRQGTLASLQQLIVAGNALEYIQPDNSLRVFRLDQYVVRRNSRGRFIELIIQEKFKADQKPAETDAPSGADEDEDVELYTKVELVREKNREFYRRTQQWGDGQKASEPAAWPVREVPYIPLRWSATPGEDYGRSKVEEHIADFRSLDSLEKANLEMAAMASRNFITIAPGANASSVKNRLVRAINGDVVVADGAAIELKSFENVQGYQITSNQVEVIRESISSAFLLGSISQRDAERVTAREIERDIQELEATLGGTFSMLSQDMMETRSQILIAQMKAQEKLPPFEDDAVVPVILTGLEALSRERDVGRAMQAAQIAQAFGPEAIDVVKLDKIISAAYIGLGFPDAVRSEEEAAQLRAQRQQAQAMAQAAQDTIPKVAQEAVKQEGQNG